MSGFLRWFGGNRSKDTTKDTIVRFQEMLALYDKKEEVLERQIAEQTEIARKNATTNKRCTSIVKLPSGNVPFA